MDAINIILGGLGGQGILFMTRVLAEAALDKGLNIIGAETHGMAQRGGSVISHLRIGDAGSSLIRTGTAHLLLSLDENEGYRNLPFLCRGGKMYLNADSDRLPTEAISAFLDGREIIRRSIPAGAIAIEAGAPRSSNLALLGYFAAFDEGPIGYKELKMTIERIGPERFRQVNAAVFDVGYRKGKGLQE